MIRRSSLSSILTLTILVLATLSVAPMASAEPLHSPSSVRVASATYNVTFTETGLPTGTQWNVTFDGHLQSSTTTTNVFSSYSNGKYAFTVQTPVMGTSIEGIALEEYQTTDGVGTITVSNANVNKEIKYSTYYVLDTMAGDASEGTVSPPLGYYISGSMISIQAFSLPNYTFSGWTGICYALTLNCSYTGSDNPATVDLLGPCIEVASFVVLTYNVAFTESGLPANTDWQVTLNGTVSSELNSTIAFSEMNGTYAYSVLTPLPFGTGAQFVDNSPSGSLTVNGQAVSMAERFVEQFELTVATPVRGTGEVTGTSGWYDSGAVVHLNATSSPGYEFIRWVGSGTGNYSGNRSNTSVTMGGPITEKAVFEPLYSVTINETGLPTGTIWSVKVEGNKLNSNTTSISTYLTNGTYNYVLSTIPGYAANVRTGTFNVSGVTTNLTVGFHQVTYIISVYESGLPQGSTWTVVFSPTSNISADTSMISFTEPNGSFLFTVEGSGGYTVSPSQVSFNVTGTPLNINVTFVAPPADTGPLGIGVTQSYLVIGLVVIAGALMAGLWAQALYNLSKRKRSVRERAQRRSAQAKSGGSSAKEGAAKPSKSASETGTNAKPEESSTWADSGEKN